MKPATALILPIAFTVLSCANQTSPMGGPKDESPPVLTRSSPDSAERNFHGRNIELTFNEMLQLNNPKEEIIITPPVGKKTQFKLKDNRVTIEPESPLRENTTYTINFREGIKDITEGNAAADLYLAFSTGPVLDSLSIQGTLKNALKEEIPLNLTVALYQSDTFRIMEHSPDYFTKSAKDGTFQISNLKPGSYGLYAFNDKNKNLKLESQSEEFGFSAKPIELTTSVTKLSLVTTRLDSRPLKLSTVRNQSTLNTIRFNKQVNTYSLRSSVRILSTFGTSQAEILAHYPNITGGQGKDSIMVSLTATDSIEQRIDTSFYIRRDANEKIAEPFRTNTLDPVLIAETNHLEFSMTFNKPIASFNPDSLFILSDTATIIPLRIANIRIDTIHNQFTYTHDLQPADSLIRPELHVGKGFLMSIDGDSSKAQAVEVTVRNQANSATLLVEVQTRHPNYIVEVINRSNRVVARAINTSKPVFRYLAPQTLRVRVIIDENGNGKWDTANYLQNKEPERAVYYINSEKKTDIPMRANWEVGPNVIKL